MAQRKWGPLRMMRHNKSTTQRMLLPMTKHFIVSNQTIGRVSQSYTYSLVRSNACVCVCVCCMVTNFIPCHLWAFSFSLVHPVPRSLFTLLLSSATWMCSTPCFFTIRTCWPLTQPLLFYVLHFPSIMRPFNGIFYRNHQNGHLWLMFARFFPSPSLRSYFVYVCTSVCGSFPLTESMPCICEALR